MSLFVCSDVGFVPRLPDGTTFGDIQKACILPFPAGVQPAGKLVPVFTRDEKLTTLSAAATQTPIPECPNGDLNLADCPS